MKPLLKQTITLATIALMGCFGVESEPSSKIIVSVSEKTLLAKTVADNEYIAVDTLDLDTISSDTIVLRYPARVNTAYEVLVTGVVSCNTSIGSSVMYDITVDSLIVKTVIQDGCDISVDISTDTIKYAQRLSELSRWDEVFELIGYEITDSTIAYNYITDITAFNFGYYPIYSVTMAPDLKFDFFRLFGDTNVSEAEKMRVTGLFSWYRDYFGITRFKSCVNDVDNAWIVVPINHEATELINDFMYSTETVTFVRENGEVRCKTFK